MATHEAAGVREAIERAEARIARAYAVIDRGDSVDDLTAPGAVLKIREMDRLGLTARGPRFLTYPEDEGVGGPEEEEKEDEEEDDDETIGRTALALRRAERLPLVTTTDARGVTTRPARRVEYDASVGVGPEPRVEDWIKDAEKGEYTPSGEVSEAMYRDLDSID